MSLPPSGQPWSRPDADIADDIRAVIEAARLAALRDYGMTETVHCPHDGERVHGPGAGWYCGECGTNLPAPDVG